MVGPTSSTAPAFSRPQRKRWAVVGLVAGLVCVLGLGVWWAWSASPVGDALSQQLEGLGRVAVVPVAPNAETSTFEGLSIDGLELVSSNPLGDVLDSEDGALIGARMQDLGIDALLIEGGGSPAEATVRDQLLSYAHVDGLRALYLDPTGALYVPGARTELGSSAAVTARIARTILDGIPPPPIPSFPEPLRRIRNVEVMVLLRDFGTARLWRSARGSSIARALLTATMAARQRWRERERALGGPLDRRLASLDVEVFLLEEDGTLGATTPAFVERVFGPEHGVAYAKPGAWRYLLPDKTQEVGEGSAVAAYRQLFRDNGLPDDSLSRRDLRFYRLVSTPLGEHPATGFAPLPDPR